jgi:hypothetical protein
LSGYAGIIKRCHFAHDAAGGAYNAGDLKTTDFAQYLRSIKLLNLPAPILTEIAMISIEKESSNAFVPFLNLSV